jgi:hypothetical protein
MLVNSEGEMVGERGAVTAGRMPVWIERAVGVGAGAEVEEVEV